ncbi:EF-hand domain-containing family member C2 [Protopterus annectens]|uniref:EF-hand domain-containing family member C2 n=1 Tax=Protopterus annectens TaxID=7888 RepID=UPI001CFA7337|nr:EF-hand domain-containing family member C2 [Protopterus annectens]
MALPFLPGNSFNRNLGKEKFHKSQHFDYANGTPMLIGEEKPGIGGEPLLGQTLKPKYSVFPKGVGSNAPSWVAFDKQVLSFDAYFYEAVTEKREEKYRVRQCKIYFYLEDDTIQVVEPPMKNSGMPQGTLIRRHRVPLPPPHDDEFYRLEHFNINKEIVLYSRVYTITDCDQFTQNFLRKLGIRLNPPSSVPKDPYSTLRKQMEEGLKPLRPYERIDTLRQFLEHDRHVLRFFCIWDDTDSMFGDIRELILHYFLSDDTIEIKEILGSNSGRDALPVFLQRRMLPKHVPLQTRQPGEITSRTVLNVFGPSGQGGRYILDSLKTGAVNEEFYKDCDLRIGQTINVWGRKVLICDYDEYTKEHYRTKYGIEDFTPVMYKSPASEKIKKTFPPYNGFGSEEDSLCSCLGLLPKPPQRDFKKFIEKDRQGLESNVLRFVGILLNEGGPIDVDRKFIILYFLSDDTIAVFEPSQRNSGRDGGKFLERGRIKKPGQELFKSEMSEYFKAKDLFVGANVSFHGHNFLLIDADEYAFNYMERHADEFPLANIDAVLSKLKNIDESTLKEISQHFTAQDPENTGIIGYDQFRNLIIQVSGIRLLEHEIMTVGRYYSPEQQSEVDIQFLLALSQDQLKKKSFENFSRLLDAFVYRDQERCGFLPFHEARTICMAFRLPLPNDLIQALLERYQDGHGNVEYTKLLSDLNWRQNPLSPSLTLQASTLHEKEWLCETTAHAVKKVNYSSFLEDISKVK